MKSKTKKLLKTLLIFVLVSSWLLAGWPPIWLNPRIPPKIQEAQALSGANYIQTEACTTACTGTHTAFTSGQAATITIPDQGGTSDWLVIVNWEQTNSSISYYTEVQVQYDNSTQYALVSKMPANATESNEYPNYGTMFMLDDIASGSHTIDVDYRSNNAAGTAKIRNIHLVALRLDDILSSSDYAYATNAAAQTLTTSFTSYLSTSITPGSAGKYLFLMSAEGYSGGTSDSVEMYLDIAGTAYPLLNPWEASTYMGAEAFNAAQFDTYLHGAVVNISSQTTFQIYAAIPNGVVGTNHLRNRRIFAMRLDSFGAENTGFFEAQNWNWAQEGVTTPTVRTTLTFTPPEPADYLIMAFGIARADSNTYYSWQDLNWSTGDGVMQQGGHDMKDNSTPACERPFSYAEILEDLPVSSQTFQHRHWDVTVSTATSDVGGSQIVAIRLNTAGAAVTVAASADSTQPTGVADPDSDVLMGAFTMVAESTVPVTQIVLNEEGTVTANGNLTDVRIWWKQESTCQTSIPGDATAFNSSGVSFGASDQATVTNTGASISVGTSNVCVYVRIDVGSGVSGGESIEIEITVVGDVTITGGYATGSFPVQLVSTTYVKASTGTVCSTAITFSDFSGSPTAWNELFWTETEGGGASVIMQIASNSDCTSLISDGAFSGCDFSNQPEANNTNSEGFAVSPVDVSCLDEGTYGVIYLKTTLTAGTGSPTLSDWGVSVPENPWLLFGLTPLLLGLMRKFRKKMELRR